MISIFCALALLLAAPAFPQSINKIYELPTIAKKPGKKNTATVLAGSNKGLFRVTDTGSAIALWTDGRVEQIFRVEIPGDSKIEQALWYFRTSQGILFSSDLVHFEYRNEGLPILTVKKYNGSETTFEYRPYDLKDFSVNPLNPQEMVTATKDAVYLSQDGGLQWKSIGSTSTATSGIKAVAIATMPDGVTAVFMSHTIFGLSYYIPAAAQPKWIDAPRGLYKLPSLTSPDEVADILPIVRTPADSAPFVEVYLSQMYLPRIYKFDWKTKTSVGVYTGKEPAESIDGLTLIDSILLFTKNEGLGAIDIDTFESPGIPAAFATWKKALSGVPGLVNGAWIPQRHSGFSHGVLLNELWMLYPGTINTPYAKIVDRKKSLYVSAYQCRVQSGIDKFRKIIADNNLNSLVIDMKDDYGFLRYESIDPLVTEKGRVTQYKIDLDHFVSEFKKDNVYLIARIVVFKDRNLSRYKNGAYAVWDKVNKKPWIGQKGTEKITDEAGTVTQERMTYYDENWVDPYAPEVWEYNVAIAKELITRGFDEIQFDYIRFPTDGLNLYAAAYRHQSNGMDKESALISFLSYARENIKAPIGIDIYGANGWYRSGTRTGQDPELLAEYVDVIAPMYYPSHFENAFLNYAPYPDRTYRIYYYGTYRATMMTRNRAVIRPWVQAFKLNVAFDRTYYGPDYIQKQVFGTRDAADRGYMYWNNAGNYENLLPDTGDAAYTGAALEAAREFRKPAIGTEISPTYEDEGITVLDNVLRQRRNVGEAKRTDGFLLLQSPFFAQ